MATLQNFLDRIYQLNDDFNIFTAKKNPATVEQIQEFEQQKSLVFPNEFKEFLTQLGVVIIEVDEKIWQRPQEFDVMPAWEFGYGMFVYGLDQNYSSDNHWLYYDNTYDDELDGVLFYERSGGLLKAYLNKKGEIFLETDPYSEWDDMEKYDGNLFDFLIEQVNELEKDYQAYISEK